MTFGDLDKTIPEETKGEQTNWTPFDWTSEAYQLMCREYRQSLGIVNMSNYESRYETASERLYWANLYKVRGYGVYEGKRYYAGKQISLLVIPDPPEAWQQEWTRKNGVNIRDDPNEPSFKSDKITVEQEAAGRGYLKRLESVRIKDEKGEIIAITDANLLCEFQIWLAEENLTVTEETAKLIRDSWTRLFEEERKAAIVTTSNAASSPEYQEYD